MVVSSSLGTNYHVLLLDFLICMVSTINLAFRPSFWLIPLGLAHKFSFEPSARYYVYLGD